MTPTVAAAAISHQSSTPRRGRRAPCKALRIAPVAAAVAAGLPRRPAWELPVPFGLGKHLGFFLFRGEQEVLCPEVLCELLDEVLSFCCVAWLGLSGGCCLAVLQAARRLVAGVGANGRG